MFRNISYFESGNQFLMLQRLQFLR